MTDSNTAPSFPGLVPDISWTWQQYDPGRRAELLSWLSEAEKVAVATYRSEKRRTEFVLGRAAARRLVAERLGISPPEVRLEVAADGAVEIVGSDLNLSISHAGGWATAVVSPRPVGIDMERLAMRRPGVYRYFLAKSEYPFLEGTDLDHDSVQILLWTLKEAVLKGMRTGLRISPKDVKLVSVTPEGLALAEDRDERNWRLGWVFWRNCYLAIADRENLP